MLQKAKGANATVTVAHTGTKDLRLTANAPTFLSWPQEFRLVKPEWIKPALCH